MEASAFGGDDFFWLVVVAFFSGRYAQNRRPNCAGRILILYLKNLVSRPIGYRAGRMLMVPVQDTIAMAVSGVPV